MTTKLYRVIKPYYALIGETPLCLPVGTILTYWEERGFYLSEAVNNICCPVTKWVVESWHDYFEKVEAE